MDQEQLNKQFEKLIQYCSKNNSEQCRSVLQFCKSSRNVNRMLLDRLSDMAGLNSSITRGDGNANGNQINQQSDKFLSMILFLMKVDKDFADKIQQLSRNNASPEQENVVSEINFTSHYITENGEDKAQQIKINKLKNDNKDTNLFMFNVSSPSNDQSKNMPNSQPIAFKILNTNGSFDRLSIENCNNYFTDNKCNNNFINITDWKESKIGWYDIIMKNIEKIETLIENYSKNNQKDFLFLILNDNNIVDKSIDRYVYIYTKLDLNNANDSNHVNNIILKYVYFDFNAENNKLHDNYSENHKFHDNYINIYENTISYVESQQPSLDGNVNHNTLTLTFNHTHIKSEYDTFKKNIVLIHFLLINDKTNIYKTAVKNEFNEGYYKISNHDIETTLQLLKNENNLCTSYSTDDMLVYYFLVRSDNNKYRFDVKLKTNDHLTSSFNITYYRNNNTFKTTDETKYYLPAIKKVKNDTPNTDGELLHYYVCDESFKNIFNDERIVNGKIDCINITNDEFTTYSIVTKSNNEFYTYIISMLSINNNDVNDVKLYDDICYDAKLKKFYDKSTFDNYVEKMSNEERKKFEEERLRQEEDELNREEEQRRHDEEERLRRDAEGLRQEEEQRKRDEEEQRKRDEEARISFEEEQRRREEEERKRREEEERKRREEEERKRREEERKDPEPGNNNIDYDLINEFIFALHTMTNESYKQLIDNLKNFTKYSEVTQSFNTMNLKLNINRNANEPYYTTTIEPVEFIFFIDNKSFKRYENRWYDVYEIRIFNHDRSKFFRAKYDSNLKDFVYSLSEDTFGNPKYSIIKINELQQKKIKDEPKDNNHYLEIIQNQDWIKENINNITSNNMNYFVFTNDKYNVYIKVSLVCSNNDKDKYTQYIVKMRYHVKSRNKQINNNEIDFTTVFYDTATKTFLNSTKEFDEDKCIKLTNIPEQPNPGIPPPENDPVPRNPIPENPLPRDNDPVPRNPIPGIPPPENDPVPRDPIPERESKPTIKHIDPRTVERYIQGISSVIFNFNDFLNNYTTIKTRLEDLRNYIDGSTLPV